MNKLTANWKQEERAAFSAWGASRPADCMAEEALPWRYEKWLREFLKPATRLLNMGAGGGAFLFSLRHPFVLTSATESREKYYDLCKSRLTPLGVTVAKWAAGAPLPFRDGSFDLVLNWHEAYDLPEIYRVLRPGGHFITEQVGAQDAAASAGLKDPAYNLENQTIAFQCAGFRVVKSEQFYEQKGIAAYMHRFILIGKKQAL